MTKKKSNITIEITFLSDAQLAIRFSVNRVTIWRWRKTDPTFPQPVKLSPGATRWRLSEIEAWEQSRTKLA